jgi:peptidoglycan hydrolase-like protein with peptidoglycan-binding domain
MKHLLNNLSEEEKNRIREQHTGGMKVITENFSRLMNGKHGDSKPLINEEPLPKELKIGSKGEWVKKAQEKLGVNPSDGNFGDKTDKAVRLYQEKHGLTVDGIIGGKTAAKLGFFQ